jgi:hypothetical protein
MRPIGTRDTGGSRVPETGWPGGKDVGACFDRDLPQSVHTEPRTIRRDCNLDLQSDDVSPERPMPYRVSLPVGSVGGGSVVRKLLPHSEAVW